jgi:hypothetical protein
MITEIRGRFESTGGNWMVQFDDCKIAIQTSSKPIDIADAEELANVIISIAKQQKEATK